VVIRNHGGHNIRFQSFRKTSGAAKKTWQLLVVLRIGAYVPIGIKALIIEALHEK
jgi:hypothetical protein